MYHKHWGLKGGTNWTAYSKFILLRILSYERNVCLRQQWGKEWILVQDRFQGLNCWMKTPWRPSTWRMIFIIQKSLHSCLNSLAQVQFNSSLFWCIVYLSVNFEVTVCRKDSSSEKSALPYLHILCHDYALEELIYVSLPCHLVGQVIL